MWPLRVWAGKTHRLPAAAGIDHYLASGAAS
jgi:hypothetical protein